MVRTVREKAINLTGERRVDRIWGDVIRYLVLVDWLMIVATIVRRPGWSTIQLFHESRCVVARLSHRRRIPAIRFASFFSFFLSNLCWTIISQCYKCKVIRFFKWLTMIIKKSLNVMSKRLVINKYKKRLL